MKILFPDKNTAGRWLTVALVLSAPVVVNSVHNGSGWRVWVGDLLGCLIICVGAIAYLIFRTNITAAWRGHQGRKISDE